MSNTTTNPMNPVVIDIGENISKILEVLSTKLGTTSDHLMQVYVKQVQIEGYGFLILNVLFMLVVSMVIFYANKKAKYIDDRNSEWNGAATIVAVFLGLGVVGMIVLFCGVTDAYTKIVNPEAYAFQYFARNIGTLIGR